MTSPAFAVIGLPELVEPIKQVGYALLSDDVDPSVVAAAAREAVAKERPYVVLLAGDAPILRVWARVQATQGRRVLWLRSEKLPVGELPERANALDLPASLNDVLSAFGAPSVDGVGDLVIQVDGSITQPQEPAARAVEGSASSTGRSTSMPSDVFEFGPDETDYLDDDLEEAEPVPEPKPLLRVVSDREREPMPPSAVFVPPVPPPAQGARKKCPVIICFAGKGGVGKTTLSLALAQRAHVVGGLDRVVAADANRGQGDMRRILRVSRSGLPSIYDSAVTGDPQSSLVTPEMLTSARHQNLPVLGIGAILAPDDAQADPHKVTAEVYRDAIDTVRSVADLVVIDTQIVEAQDLSGLIDRLVIPMLRDDAWGLGLTDSSVPGADNLLRRLQDFSAKGVPRDRLMVAMNRKEPGSEISVEQLTELLTSYVGSYVGTVTSRSDVHKAFEQGTLPHQDDELAVVLDAVLWRVTGLASFSNPTSKKTPKKDGGSFISRLWKRN